MQNRTRLLGVELDTMLRMTGHVEQVSARLAKANNILRAPAGAKWGSSKETMLRTFKAIIKPLAKTKLERQYTAGLPRNEDAAAERRADTGKRATCNRGPEDAWPPNQRPKPQETKGKIKEEMNGEECEETQKLYKNYIIHHGIHPILGRQPPPLSEEEAVTPFDPGGDADP
uniref:Uncharacterized protein n=1 Tax=Caenorhabditis japonica TaxID=281687 RepID=A0A8R1EA04_CAEJA